MRIEEGGVSAEAVVAVVKSSVKRGNLAPAVQDTDMRVSAVELVLKVVAGRSRGGRLTFRIPVIGTPVSLGGTVKRVNTQSITIALVPPPPAAEHEVRDGEVEQALVDAVATVRQVVAAAALGDDPWQLREGKVELEFAVTDTGSIVVGIEAEQTGEITHTLRLMLEPGA